MAGQRTKPRLKKLRVLFVLFGLSILAVVSLVFGMMTAVSRDLPALYDFAQFKASRNSEVYDASGEPIGTLTSDQNKILLTSGQISPNVKNAVVAVEDARFYEHNGVDFQGIGRALVRDLLSQSAQQGASTITEQFVKEALAAQESRTILQKFREAALAYRLEHHWSKDKILTEYLNTVYFGEGAYGVEAAARTYFGAAHPGCGTPEEPCATVLEPWEAALLAAIINSPTAYNPKFFPENALARRNLVLEKMYEQGYISEPQLAEGVQQALPAPSEIKPPTLDSKAPYFTAWLRQQLVDRYGAAKAFFGGLKVKTTLNMRLQNAAEEAVNSYLGYLPPTASVVVINNKNAGVMAMVGGPNFETKPFNLATQGRRQPGSSIKPFELITALEEGISPYTSYESAPQEFHFGKHGQETFVVHNDEGSYLGSCDLICATTYSDNSIYSQLALEGLEGRTIADRTRSIAATIHKMGYRDPISTNPAMVLGGLEEGVSPLGWAYAYSTIANDGDRVSGTLAPEPGDSPVAYTQVTDREGHTIRGGDNDSLHERVISEDTAKEAKSILETVVQQGTGTHANTGAPGLWGKTGTTEESGDAWFCGGSEEITACVWVGYADTVTPMTTLYNGGPVQGGTYPAEIWASVVSAWEGIRDELTAEHKAEQASRSERPGSGSSAPAEGEEEGYAPSEPEPEAAPEPEAPEAAPEPEAAPTPEAAPQEAAPESGGAGGGITAG
ncbi:MAG TPA: transglycosylase domain-containing protein [Solirubrobacterales bacterium]|nr:transglycosylase domain-containing protein [Solirubrobacterales bacterium]